MRPRYGYKKPWQDFVKERADTEGRTLPSMLVKLPTPTTTPSTSRQVAADPKAALSFPSFSTEDDVPDVRSGHRIERGLAHCGGPRLEHQNAGAPNELPRRARAWTFSSLFVLGLVTSPNPQARKRSARIPQAARAFPQSEAR